MVDRTADGPNDAPDPSQKMSRRRLARWLTAATVTVPVTGAAAALASAAGSGPTGRDREVLRFARMLEQLQAAFYAEALRAGRLTGEPRQFAETVGRQEQAHLRYLRDELGAAAPPAAHYRFGDALRDDRAFVATAVRLEETGVAAYNGQAENVSRSTLRGLSRVMSVESRHAAWARAMAGRQPAPVAADVPISAAAALKAIQPFIA